MLYKCFVPLQVGKNLNSIIQCFNHFTTTCSIGAAEVKKALSQYIYLRRAGILSVNVNWASGSTGGYLLPVVKGLRFISYFVDK